MINPNELPERIKEALVCISEYPDREAIHNELYSGVFTGWDVADMLYQPSQDLLTRLENYEQWYESIEDGGNGENKGNLMEELVFLAFCSLKGYEKVKSYQSFSVQHDLVISGSDDNWNLLMQYLHLPKNGRTIVIEAKNLSNTISDQQFSRLCHVVQNKFDMTCHLGVFFSRKGASGFDQHRCLTNARATQILFHAKTGKFVIVFDHSDLQQLKEKGSLPKLLEKKIRDVEAVAKSDEFEFNDGSGEYKEMESLPSHLLKWVK